MSKLDELIGKYKADLEGMDVKVDEALLTAVAKGCGPLIYRKDASLVAASDKKEVERVKQNFCIKKLGAADTPKLDESLAEVLKSYKKRNKHRVVVYYLLTKKLRKSAVYK